MKTSSKFNKEIPSNGVARQDIDKGFGVDFPNVFMGLKMIQNSP